MSSSSPAAPKVLEQPGVPGATKVLHIAKAKSALTFAQIAEKIGRNELWVAALFYGQAKPDPEDLAKLSEVLNVPVAELEGDFGEHFFPDRGGLSSMPPRDPVLYRFYEAVAVYGYPMKHIIHEKFGDGIMSAIDFKGSVERVPDPKGDRVVITWNGKFLPFARPTS
ncbi:Cyanate hydratase [Tilletia horrida]|uniref:Cyanate hydratase n=1 Tax=Tilletia horrida TaxID=155126 RepID=A0AAN6GNB8_9BASI|nr:Cyanate hydratase [Tilletia horrida]KAK0546465.1 Cyanate hydratase [Tilletia horrida]